MRLAEEGSPLQQHIVQQFNSLHASHFPSLDARTGKIQIASEEFLNPMRLYARVRRLVIPTIEGQSLNIVHYCA